MYKKAILLCMLISLLVCFFSVSDSTRVCEVRYNTKGKINPNKLSTDAIKKYDYQQNAEEKKMKVIGLLGGMSWHSTVEYYRIINELISERLGGYHSAHVIIYSVDFAPIEKGHRENRWDDLGDILADAAKALKNAGAEFIVICANTMHKVAEPVEKASGLPLLHIADATGQAIKEQGLHKIGLLGTKFTMQEDFIKNRLKERFALEVIVPDESEQKTINQIIYEELGKGIIKESSRKAYVEIINKLIKRGAEGIILGCTEIPLLIRPQDVDIPTFNTTRLHAEAAVDFALSEISEN
jgi:aspartate racemase